MAYILSPRKRTQHCWPITPNIAQSLKAVKLFRQQLTTFLLLRDRQNVAQDC